MMLRSSLLFLPKTKLSSVRFDVNCRVRKLDCCRFVSSHNAIRRVSPRSFVLSREVPETAASILRVERALGS